MAAFEIVFYNFCVFVHHARGLGVIPGKVGHDLIFKDDSGTETAVTQDVRLIATRGTTEINGGPTGVPDPDGYMVELSWMLGASHQIPDERVFGHDRSFQHPRIHLHGGRLRALPALPEDPNARPDLNLLPELLWDYRDIGAKYPGLHRITNRAVFSCEMAPETEYALEVEGHRVPMTAGRSVRFANRDLTACDEPSGRNDEVVDLLKAVSVQLRTAPVVADERQLEHEKRIHGETCKPCDMVYADQR